LKNEKAGAKIDFPQQIVVGYSFRPTPKWNLEFNFDWTDWDTLNNVTLTTQKPMVIPFNYQSSALFEWGVTRCFEKGWSVSGGYMYSQNSVPNASFNPSVPDSDRHLFSVGIGKQFDHLRCEAAYQLAYGPDRDINLGANNPVTGQYSFLSHAIALSLGYAF
jgi:long-chain fatty acid transport protein